MAGMDFIFNRGDRGISVFWLILVMGAGVFALLAILLLSADSGEDAAYGDEGNVEAVEVEAASDE